MGDRRGAAARRRGDGVRRRAGGGEEEAKAQTVTFQKPVDVGPDPFVDKPADRKGKKKVKITPSSTAVGAGPFGGTGSDLVCDRDLLVRLAQGAAGALVEWARVLGVEPTIKAVGTYITKLHPVTLTRDTRVTNHSFVNGRAVGYQGILAAGTAVLVDDYGNPVVRCRCGNPLLKPVFIPSAVCLGCPPRYAAAATLPVHRGSDLPRAAGIRAGTTPTRSTTRSSSGASAARATRAYPDPPRVRITDIYDPELKPPPTAASRRRRRLLASPHGPAAAAVQRVRVVLAAVGTGLPVLHAERGRLRAQPHAVDLARAAGRRQRELLDDDRRPTAPAPTRSSAGAQCANDVQGTYTATVRDSADRRLGDGVGDVSGGGRRSGGGGGGTGELQCDPPRSQLESEQCAEAGRP